MVEQICPTCGCEIGDVDMKKKELCIAVNPVQLVINANVVAVQL